VTIYLVYIAEAHSVDGWQTDSNDQEGIRIKQHASLEGRIEAALLCSRKLGLSIPTLVDDMKNTALEAFAAWPERIVIVDANGRISYKGGQGPFDFKPEEARASLVPLLAAQ